MGRRDHRRQGDRRRPGRRRVPEPERPKYHGKGMRLRAVGYAGGMLVVPVAWRLRGRPGAVSPRAGPGGDPAAPDGRGGNASGIYRRAHVDDLIHFADGAVVPRWSGRWRRRGSGRRGRRPGSRRRRGDARPDCGRSASGSAEARCPGHGPVVRRHDDRPDRDDGGGDARRRSITLLRHPSRLRRVPGARRTRSSSYSRRRPAGSGA